MQHQAPGRHHLNCLKYIRAAFIFSLSPVNNIISPALNLKSGSGFGMDFRASSYTL